MNLSYTVITMVDRDDLPDGGALHIAKTIEEIQKKKILKTRIEILAGDFSGQEESINRVVHAEVRT